MANVRRSTSSGAARIGTSRRASAANDDPPATLRGRLGGRVVDGDGHPVPGAQVIIASGPTHHDIAMETGPDGRFDYGVIEAGRYLLTVQAIGFATRREDVRVLPRMRAETLVVLQRRPAPPQGREPMPEPWPEPTPGEPGGGTGGGRWVAPEAPPDPEEEGWESPS